MFSLKLLHTCTSSMVQPGVTAKSEKFTKTFDSCAYTRTFLTGLFQVMPWELCWKVPLKTSGWGQLLKPSAQVFGKGCQLISGGLGGIKKMGNCRRTFLISKNPQGNLTQSWKLHQIISTNNLCSDSGCVCYVTRVAWNLRQEIHSDGISRLII